MNSNNQGNFVKRIPNASKKIHGIDVNVDVVSVRARTELSQTDFCETYGFNLDTLKNWEQGRRKPDPTSAIFLHLIDRNPQVAKELIDGLKSEGLFTYKTKNPVITL